MLDEFDNAVRVGFLRGVGRAYENGLDIGVVHGSEEEFIKKMTSVMKRECVLENKQQWNLGAVRFCGEVITVGEIARRNYRDQGEKPFENAEMVTVVKEFGKTLNSAKHPVKPPKKGAK